MNWFQRDCSALHQLWDLLFSHIKFQVVCCIFFHQKIHCKVCFGNDSSSNSTFGLVFLPIVVFLCGHYSGKYLKEMFNETKYWYPTTDREVAVEATAPLCQLCLQIHIVMAYGFCLAKWLGLLHGVLRDLYWNFLTDSLRVLHCGCGRGRETVYHSPTSDL